MHETTPPPGATAPVFYDEEGHAHGDGGTLFGFWLYLMSDAIIFALGTEASRPLADIIARHFEKVEPLGKIQVHLGKDHQRIFDVYLGRNLRTWNAVGPRFVRKESMRIRSH